MVKLNEGRKPLSKLIDAEKSFNFQPYAYTPWEVTPNLFYAESSKEILIVPWGGIPIGAYFFLVVIAPTLLPLKLESGESMTSYNVGSFNNLGSTRGGSVDRGRHLCVSVWADAS